MSFAGMVRTLVAVGTVRLESMFDARALAAPRSGATTFSAWGLAAASAFNVSIGVVVGASAGMGCGLGSIEVVRATGWLPVLGFASSTKGFSAGASEGAAGVAALAGCGAAGVFAGAAAGASVGFALGAGVVGAES
tara:strand:+ start:14084 stop:14491 length:408 start_codon:yes stop_codon:yes gene_type:complete